MRCDSSLDFEQGRHMLQRIDMHNDYFLE
jgi:hypothetical protein